MPNRVLTLRLKIGLCLSAASLFLPTCAAPAASAAQAAKGLASGKAGEWSPEQIYAILSSSDSGATGQLYRKAFVAGRAILPQLQADLKDDRSAEFAAQALAFMGGPKALAVLAGLVDDPRDLDLRRFYYGALAEYHDARSTAILLDAVRRSNHEPDRTVTEAAILALSVRSDPGLAAKLRQLEVSVNDYVVQDILETAASVIQLRAQYLSSPQTKAAKDTIEQAIRTYFIPALESPPPGSTPSEATPRADFHVQDLTYSPDQSRALADVVFETSQAFADYRIVLQKKQAAWIVASVWLGREGEKPQPSAAGAKPQ